MNEAQKKQAFALFLGYLERDWVQLPIAVACANEAVGFDDRSIVTSEAREFVTSLFAERGMIAGSVAQNAGFIAWLGSKEDRLARVLALMPLGASVQEEYSVWFDQAERKTPN